MNKETDFYEIRSVYSMAQQDMLKAGWVKEEK